jgi:uncharacterized protein (TIGR04255 family)
LYRNENAIQEVVFSLFFDNQLTHAHIEKLIAKPVEVLRAAYTVSVNPLFNHRQQISITPEGLSQIQNQSVCGFCLSLSASEPDNTTEWNLLFSSDAVGKFFISFHGYRYTRWNDMLEKALDFLSCLSEKETEDLRIKALGVNYIDIVSWESDSYPPLDRLLNTDSDWLPSQLLNSTEELDYSLSKSITEADFRRVDFLKFSLTRGLPVSYNLQIAHRLVRESFTSKSIPEAELKTTWQWIHEQNKAMIGNILSEVVTRKMKGFHSSPISQ